MKPEEIAEIILEGHLTNKPIIDSIPNFRLDLQLNYSGLMARGAYRQWKEIRNKDRKKVGCFDFKIFRLTSDGDLPMLHPRVIEDVGEKLNRDAVERIFRGENPLEIGLNEEVMVTLREAQLAMLEQEINWGDESFQSWSKFLPSDGKRPRDFVMAYFRRILEEPDFLQGIKRKRAASGTWNVLPPPDGREWKPYKEPIGSNIKPWLTGNLLEQFKKAAESMPENPEYAKSYRT